MRYATATEASSSLAHRVGGILLGPTAFGWIPGFTDHIFPAQSRSYLLFVANIDLSLFLFLGWVRNRRWCDKT